MIIAVQTRVAAPPYPEEQPHVAGVAVPGPVVEVAGCTATTRSGDPCKGRPGDDGLCAAHKDQA